MLFSRRQSKHPAVSRAAKAAVEPLEQRVFLYTASVGVNASDLHQTMDGFGAAMASWKSVTGYADAAFYDRIVNDLGATMARTAIWPTFEEGNDNSDPNSFNWAGFDKNAIAYSMTFMKRLADRGMKNLLATVWTPPTHVKTNQTYYFGGAIRPDMRAEFAEYLAAVAISAQRDFGVDLSHISIQNEPFFVQEYESATYTAEQMREAVRATMRKFAAEGLDTQIVAPEEMASGDRFRWYVNALMNDPETRAFPGAFGFHPPTSHIWRDVGSLVAPFDQPLWATESHSHEQTIAGALKMAEDMWSSIAEGEASAFLYWQWSETAGDGKHSLMIDGQPAIKYHVAKQIYRYVRPGAVRIGASSSDSRLKTLSFKHPTSGAVTHVLINNQTSSADVTLNLSGSGLPSSYKVYRTSGSENHVQLANVTGGSQVSLTLPASSIVTLYSGADLQPVIASSGGALPGRQNLHDPVIDDRLNRAAVEGNLGDIREWLSLGDDVNGTIYGGYSALHAAAAGPYVTATDAINELLSRGANVAQKTNEGFTPLHSAAMNVWTRGSTTVTTLAADKIRALTNAGADPNAKDNAGRTPLHWGAMMIKLSSILPPTQHGVVIDALLDGGASVNALDNAGFTPLDYAVREGNTAAANELRARGAVHGAGAPDDTTAPTADVVDVSPDPRTTGVDSVDVKFSEAVNGVGLSDFELTRDGADVMPAGAGIAKINATTWRISGLSSATGIVGTYLLKLEKSGSGITDTAGNALGGSVSDSWSFVGVGAPPDRQTINGTDGNDTILVTGSGTDIAVTVNGVEQSIDAGATELLIDGLAGDDVILVDVAVTRRLLITGSGGDDVITGGGGNDELSGANGKDRILSHGGADYLLGGAGNDYLNGEGGDDTISGGGGKDRLYGSAGENWLIAGGGNDVLFSNAGIADTLSGGDGTDTGINVDDGNDGTSNLDILASLEILARV